MTAQPMLHQEGEQRQKRRRNVLRAAVVSCSLGSFAVRLRNVSSEGLQFESSYLLPVGIEVEIRVDQATLVGTVRWSHEGKTGVQLNTPILPELSLKLSVSPAHQVDVDQKIQAVRGGLVSTDLRIGPQAADLSEVETRKRIAEEVSCAARAVDAVASVLVTHPFLSVRHAAELQNLSIASDNLEQLAALISDNWGPGAIQSLTKGNLRARLLRR